MLEDEVASSRKKILSPKPNSTDSEAKEATAVLHKGGTLLYPTDTIWGIGCDATNSEAVEKVFAIKSRPKGRAMLVVLDSVAKLPYYVSEVPPIAYDLVELAVRPLTIIYPNARNVSPLLLGEDGSLGIRIVKEPFLQRLCQFAKVPIVSTSANLSGDPAPANYAEISEAVKQQVDYVVPLFQEDTSLGVASGIIQLGVGGEVKVIRSC